MKALILAILTTLTFQFSPHAQNFQWAKKAGANSFDRSYGVATDASGNCYVTGYFRSTVSFGNTTLSTSGGDDIFITKLDQDGNFIWATKAGGVNSLDCGFAIATDPTGNCYITGQFLSTATFGNTTLTAVGNTDAFMAKLDTDGNFLWAKSIGGNAGDAGFGIATDDDGNSYITGQFSGSVNFGETTLASNTTDIFITKMDTNGSFLWAQKAGSPQVDQASSIAIDALGNCYITGQVATSFSEPGISATFGTTTITTLGKNDIFISKLDPDGNFLWTKSAGGTSRDSGFGISTDNNGNCYVTGHFSGYALFGSIELATDSDDEKDIFIAKLDTEGNFIWVKTAGGVSQDGGFGIATDTSGNCYVSGVFTITTQFGNTELTNSGSANFISKISPDGEFIWTKQAGGGALLEEINATNGHIAIDATGNCFVTGWFRGEAEFGSITLTAAGNNDDIFVFKITEGETSINETTSTPNTTLFPNPAKSTINIQTDETIQTINIYNTFGRLIQTENRNSFSISQLPAGIYMIKIQTEKGLTTKQMIKE